VKVEIVTQISTFSKKIYLSKVTKMTMLVFICAHSQHTDLVLYGNLFRMDHNWRGTSKPCGLIVGLTLRSIKVVSK